MPERVHEEIMDNATTNLISRTVVICLLILDYGLFATGNPSITYSLLGGWFAIPLIAAVIATASYGYSAVTRGERKRRFVLHLLIIGLFSAVLLTIGPYAREFASDRLQAEIGNFIKDPSGAKVAASNEALQLMLEIRKQTYSMEREAFIPTFRRMDYLFKTDAGAKYRLIVTMGWNGTPEVSLRPVDS